MGRRWGASLTPRPRSRSGVRALGPQLLSRAGDLIATSIRETTAQGVDAAGASLGTYADKRRAGQPITLRRTGALLDGLRAKRGRDEVSVAPSARHARWLGRRFAIFGLSRETVRRLDALSAEAFQAFLDHHRERS